MEDVMLGTIHHEYFPKERICDWEYVETDEYQDRIYYKPETPTGDGFYFYAVKRISYIDNDIWDNELDAVECVVNGIAYFDGIRHLYYGDDKTHNYGYHYYANINRIIDALLCLKKLEIKYCKDKL